MSEEGPVLEVGSPTEVRLFDGGINAAFASLKAQLAERDAEVARLEKLAYIGDHHFHDLTWKVRCEETVTDLREVTRERDEARAKVERLKARAERAETANAHTEAGIYEALCGLIPYVRVGMSPAQFRVVEAARLLLEREAENATLRAALEEVTGQPADMWLAKSAEARRLAALTAKEGE
jgi:hypothetical protein